MALGVGIVGLPNVGKSTLFNAITKAGALAANYPFATIDKNVGVVALPDERLDALQKLFIRGDRIPPIVPTAVEFVDIAGLVKGAHQGEGLGNQFLANIREVAAVAHVVRCFDDDNVVHVEGRVSPEEDMATINTELILADLQTLEKAVPRLEKEAHDLGPQRDAELPGRLDGRVAVGHTRARHDHVDSLDQARHALGRRGFVQVETLLAGERQTLVSGRVVGGDDPVAAFGQCRRRRPTGHGQAVDERGRSGHQLFPGKRAKSP